MSHKSVLWIFIRIRTFWPDRLNRVGPCWLLKLRQMVTHCWNTEANGDSRIWNGFFLGCSVGLVVQVQEILTCLGCCSRSQYKIFFFLNVHNSIFLSPSPRKPKRQSFWVTCLFKSVCLCFWNKNLSFFPNLHFKLVQFVVNFIRYIWYTIWKA